MIGLKLLWAYFEPLDFLHGGVGPACMPDHVCLFFCNFANGVAGHERNLSAAAAAANFEEGYLCDASKKSWEFICALNQ